MSIEQLKEQAVAAHQQKKLSEAEALYQQILEKEPEQNGMRYNLAMLYFTQNRVEQAKPLLEQVLELDPHDVDAMNGLAIIAKQTENYGEAEKLFMDVIALKKDHFHAHNNLADMYRKLHKVAESIVYYKKTLAIDPKNEEAAAMLLYQYASGCDWDGYEGLREQVDQMTDKALAEGREPAEKPFASAVLTEDIARNRTISEAFAKNAARGDFSPFSHDEHDKDPERKLHIAYFSADIHNHPTMHLMAGVFEHHNKEQFEVSMYSFGPNLEDAYRKRAEEAVDHFHEVSRVGDSDVANMIFENDVDILIDLKGHTAGNRMEILAHCPAPLQIHHIGFPGPIAAPYVPINVVDPLVVQPETAETYKEMMGMMPITYQANDNKQVHPKPETDRSKHGLPEDAFVMCSFNQSVKFEPVMFHVWLKLLNAIPEGVLWLLRLNPEAEKNIKAFAEKHGVDPNRIVFAEPVAKEKHLSRLPLADIALDTRVCNGHTTTADALWMGVPVVTWQGNHFASRVASSLLRAAGLPQLITQSAEQYEQVVLALHQKHEQRDAMRTFLNEKRLELPLFDTAKWTADYEVLLRTLWARYCSASVSS